MKTRSQKLISLVLVLMMLVTMIPAGIFSASATDVSISSADEWNAVAGTIATGDTVVLTGDIDFQGAEAQPLVAGTDAVTLTFDGQGHAIKNASASAPLIAANLTASTVKNVTFEKVAVTASGNAALIAEKVTGNSADHTFENIKVVDCDVTSTAGAAAAIVASHETGTSGSYNEAIVTATNVTIDADTTITANTFAAGVLAHATGSTSGKYVNTNVYVAATITSTYASAAGTADKYNFAVGGILGYLQASVAARSMSASFENCVVKGSLILANANDADDGALGGLIGYAMLGNGASANPFPKFTFKNVAVDLAQYTSTISKMSAFANLHNSVHIVLVYEGTNFAKNAPANELYLMYSQYYNGAKADENLVNAGSKAQLEVGTLFKVTFDENGFITALTEVDASNCEHEWSAYEDVTPATKYEAGVSQATCTICGTVDEKTTAPLGYTAVDLQADYANFTTLTINSVSDWTAVATSGLTFAGKTITLGADIDFAGAAAAPLVPASLGATTMKFDGAGHKIMDAIASAPLIAGSLTATGTSGNQGTGTEFSAATTVKNVTFQGITLTAEGDAALAVGTLTGNSMDFIFENIKVVDCDVTSTAGVAAALVATHNTGTGSYNAAHVAFTNVTIDAKTTITGYTFVAGALAYATGSTNGSYVSTNVYVAATITSTYASAAGTADKYAFFVGGILGYLSATATSRSMSASFENCVVKGSLILANANDADDGAVGGLVGYAMLGNGTVPTYTFNNVAVDLVQYTSTISKMSAFANLHNSVHVVLVCEGTNFAKNAPANELYLMYSQYYNGTKADENLVNAGSKAQLDVKTTFLAKFDSNGFVSEIVETDPENCTHVWGEYETVIEATKDEAGLAKRACTLCGLEESREIPALGYTMEDQLAEYETRDIFVIKSVEDWNTVAASGLTFAGKTITLGADLDFDGADAPTLVPAALDATSVKFDGQGYKIMNATASAPLIAGILTATATGGNPGTDTEFSAATTIQNVTFEKIAATAEGDIALIAGTLTGNSMDYIFENIKVVDCDITSTAGSAAALFVTHERGTGGSFNPSNVKITNVTVDADTNITAYNHAAGLFINATGSTNTFLTFENIYMAATIKSVFVYVDIDDRETKENESSTHETSDGNVGGLFAISADPSSRSVTYNFKNIAVVGSLITEYGAIYDGRLGGLAAYAGGIIAFNVENVVIDLVEFTGYQNYRYSLAMMQDTTAVVTYENLYVGNAPTAEYMNANGSKLFTTDVASGTAMNLPNVASMNADRQASVIVRDSDGFIVKIKETVRAAGYQQSVEIGETYSIRFLALSQLTDLTDANNVNMVITAVTASGVTKTFDTSSENCTDAEGNTAPGAKLYDNLTVYSKEGVDTGISSDLVSASSYDAEKIAGFTIYNIPTGEAITFTLTISYVNAYGVTVESAPLEMVFDAQGNGPQA